MKAIKIILVIIIILVLTFFTTGLFVKETDYTTQIAINKPIKEVFKTFSNTNNVKKWIPEFKSIDTITANFGKTGSIYKIVVDNHGQDIIMTEKVMAYVPNEKLTLFYDTDMMLKTNDYLFSEKDGITKITLNATCKSDSYIMSCVYPYFKNTLKNQDLLYLKNFKKYIEQP